MELVPRSSAGVTSLQGIIPFEKGIILFVKRNHSFFDSFCHFWHSFWSKLSFLFHTKSQETFLCFSVKKECFPGMWGMLSFVKKLRGMLSSNCGMFPEVSGMFPWLHTFQECFLAYKIGAQTQYHRSVWRLIQTREQPLAECRGRVLPGRTVTYRWSANPFEWLIRVWTGWL